MKSKKTLMLLGGLRYLVPVIEEAKKLNCHVITCDYLPDNIAHKYSDEYINASIIDKEAILKIAKEKNIDGILSFAVDPGVLTAAYVADKLNLPTPPYESVKILQNKALFREFLLKNNFNVPKAQCFTDYESAFSQLDNFNLPVIVKPTDAAGSKGVSKVESKSELKNAFYFALENSINSKEVIIEEFIESKGYSTDTDSFSINSDLQFITFNNQYFNKNAKNPFTPAGYSWPSYMEESHQNTLTKELQRLVKLLNLGSSVYNIETRVGINNKPYIMELSPRGGGNRLSEIIYKATGVNLIKNTVLAALGESIEKLKMPCYNGFWCEIILHSVSDGYFKELFIDKIIKKNVVEIDLWVKTGDFIKAFNAANDTIGTLVLKFDSVEEQSLFMENCFDLVKVINE